MTDTPTPKTRKAKPTIRERAAARLCPNCGKPSPPRKSTRGPAPIYCDQVCKKAKNNRDLRDGLSLVNMVKAWRVDRGSGEIAQAAFARVCAIADMLNEEDRNATDADGNPAPRPRADYVAAIQLANEFQSVMDLRYGKRRVNTDASAD